MRIQHILKDMRRAIQDYNMIEDGDKIAVGVSGGKDSMLLLIALNEYKKFSPYQFDILAINIDMGFEDISKEEQANLINYCRNSNIKIIIHKTNIAPVLFDIRKEKHPCSLCSKMRRGALNTVAIENGCKKIALGHHADDVLETFYLSLFYEGRVSTFKPVSYLDRTDITLIRPFIYIEEKAIKNTVLKHDFPVVFNPCKMDKNTKREMMKNLVAKLDEKIPNSKKNSLGAIFNPDRNSLWGKKIDSRNDSKNKRSKS